MGDVVNLAAVREAREPHMTGMAKCLACKQEWAQVVPVGTTTLVCPSCGCDGHMLGEVITNCEQWQCQCGWFLFRVDRQGVYCPNCGEYQKGF